MQSFARGSFLGGFFCLKTPPGRQHFAFKRLPEPGARLCLATPALRLALKLRLGCERAGRYILRVRDELVERDWAERVELVAQQDGQSGGDGGEQVDVHYSLTA